MAGDCVHGNALDLPCVPCLQDKLGRVTRERDALRSALGEPCGKGHLHDEGECCLEPLQRRCPWCRGGGDIEGLPRGAVLCEHCDGTGAATPKGGGDGG